LILALITYHLFGMGTLTGRAYPSAFKDLTVTMLGRAELFGSKTLKKPARNG